MPADIAELTGLTDDLRKARRRARKDAVAVVADFSEKIAATARALAPVDDGDLRDAITVEARGLSAEIGPESPKGAHGGLVEYGTVDTAPQSFMGPAAEMHTAGLVDALSRLGTAGL